jgi:DNA invertase Pin-like site-specific DNA recombinase
MSGKTYGYVRVSSRGQNEDRQLVAMREFGVPAERIVVEKQSGKNFERPLYLSLIQGMDRGDVLVVKSIDRLGRNYKEILEQWATLTKERAISIVVLDMPLLDTRTDRDLTGILVADIVLQLLSYVAQTEREFIRQRQAEGIAAAKERGVRFGRARIPMPKEFEALALDWWNGRVSAVQAGRKLGVSRTTFKSRAEEWCQAAGMGNHRAAPRCDRQQRD